MTRLRNFGIAALTLYALYYSVIAMPVVTGVLMARLQQSPTLTEAQVQAAADRPNTAIVILSAGQRAPSPEYGGDTVDDLSLERIRYGARLARRTGLPVLVTGGVARPGMRSHAEVMGDALASDYGISVKWRETRAANTAENAMYTAGILKSAGVREILLVTHAWHMPRSVRAFEANGLIVTPAPTAFFVPWSSSLGLFMPNASTLRMSALAIHELIGIPWYSIRYGY